MAAHLEQSLPLSLPTRPLLPSGLIHSKHTSALEQNLKTIQRTAKFILVFNVSRYVISTLRNLANNLKDPGGFQYSLMQATYHGYARMDDTVNGNFLSTYYFSQNASNTASSKATISGSDYVNGQVYTKVDIVENASIVWSPCGATGILNINNRIALTAPSGSTAAGEMSDDDATVAFTQKVLVQWRQCTS
jgi:hypothetical protein